MKCSHKEDHDFVLVYTLGNSKAKLAGECEPGLLVSCSDDDNLECFATEEEMNDRVIELGLSVTVNPYKDLL